MILYNKTFEELIDNFFVIHKIFTIDLGGGSMLAELFSFRNILLPFIIFSFLMAFDIISYFLGFLLSKIKPKNWNYDRKNLFYIYFRMIPFVGGLGVLLGSFLSSERNIKKDFKKIILGNFIFLFYSVVFTFVMIFLFGIPGVYTRTGLFQKMIILLLQ